VSDTFGGHDKGMSGMAAPLDGEHRTEGSNVVMGKGGGKSDATGASDGDGDGDSYPDDWLIDSRSQGNPYFACY
jgi:hypothetical protein